MQLYLDKLHKNYIINILININVEKNFLFQKLIKKKEIHTKVAEVSVYIINNHIFTIYRQIMCKTYITDFEEIRYISIYIYLTVDIANYNAILK